MLNGQYSQPQTVRIQDIWFATEDPTSFYNLLMI